MTLIARYRIIAYVCEGGVIHERREEGSSTFSRVFTMNPDGCRYAVVSFRDEYHVYDMFDVKMSGHGEFFPGKYHVFSDEDAALTAAVMLPATDN